MLSKRRKGLGLLLVALVVVSSALVYQKQQHGPDVFERDLLKSMGLRSKDVKTFTSDLIGTQHYIYFDETIWSSSRMRFEKYMKTHKYAFDSKLQVYIGPIAPTHVDLYLLPRDVKDIVGPDWITDTTTGVLIAY